MLIIGLKTRLSARYSKLRLVIMFFSNDFGEITLNIAKKIEYSK